MEGAWSYYNAGDYEKSREQGKQALSGAKETGNKEREAEAYTVLAWSYHGAGDYEKSIEQGKKALSGAKKTGNKKWEAEAYTVLAWSYYEAGDYEKSIERGNQALSAAKETGNKKTKAEAYTVLAWSYYDAGDYKKSIEQGKQALSGAKETGNKKWEGEAYTVLARSYYAAGDYEKSMEQGNQALSAAKETGKKKTEAEAHIVLAWSYYEAGDYEKSIEQGKQALSAAKEAEFKELEEEAHKVQAKSYHGLGDHIQAEQLLHDDGDDNDDGDGDDNNDAESDSDNNDDGNDGFVSSSFCVGGDDDNHGNIGDAVNDEISEEQDFIQEFYRLQLMGQEGDPVEQDPDKTKIHEGTVTSEGTYWDLKQGAVKLAFSPGAVSEPIPMIVLKWKCSACSLQLQEHEAIVSNVIEISTKNGHPQEFNAQVMLMLYHSAPDLQGYELVIKMQIDKETSEWVDVDGTEDLQRLRGVDTYASSQDMPDLNCFIARANITECSTYAVVSRLKSSPPYTITFNGGSFSHPDYPGVTVYIPEKAVAPNTTFPLVLKAQEIPIEEYKDQDVFVGPILRIICSGGVEFLKPVTIQLPVHIRGGPKGIPDPLSYHIRVLFQRSDGENKKWIDITSDLEPPPSFDGTFVKFQVKHVCRYTCTASRDKESVSYPGDLDRLSNVSCHPPIVARFFGYFRSSHEPSFQSILRLICCTAHFREEVLDKLEREGIKPNEDHSSITMIPGLDKAFVFVSRGGIDVSCLKDVFLRFESDAPFRKELPVRLCSDQVPVQVEFYSTPSKDKLLSTMFVPTPSVHPKAPKKPTPSGRPGLKVGKKRGRKGLRQMKVVKGNSEVESKIKTKAKKWTHKVKDGIPSNDDLEWISKKILTWRLLGRRLNFDEAVLTGFDKGNDELSEKTYKMLLTWKEREGSAATYQVLYDALCNKLVSRFDLAEEFCCLK